MTMYQYRTAPYSFADVCNIPVEQQLRNGVLELSVMWNQVGMQLFDTKAWATPTLDASASDEAMQGAS